MKRVVLVLTGILLTAAMLAGCGNTAAAGVRFNSAAVESAVRVELGLSEDAAITPESLGSVTELAVMFDENGTDLSEIKKMPNVQLLMIGGADIDSFEPLAGMEKLADIAVYDSYVADTKGLKALPALERLTFSSTGVDDISAVSELKGLKYLALPAVGIDDISFVSGLENLEYLAFPFNTVKDIIAVSNLKALEEINAEYNFIQDISPLSGAKSLKRVNLEYNAVEDVTVFDAFESMEMIHLRGNQIADGSPLNRIECDDILR
jgi:Leucine-rich repeat (LRR) protein